MKDKKTKKVVIINDIDSSTIERAILILRNNGGMAEISQSGIVNEAEKIISSYISAMENSHKKEPLKNSSGAKAILQKKWFLLLSGAIAIVAACLVLKAIGINW